MPSTQPTSNKRHPGLAWFPLFSGSWACSLYFWNNISAAVLWGPVGAQQSLCLDAAPSCSSSSGSRSSPLHATRASPTPPPSTLGLAGSAPLAGPCVGKVAAAEGRRGLGTDVCLVPGVRVMWQPPHPWRGWLLQAAESGVCGGHVQEGISGLL